jgi:hypothetical protein
MLMLEALPDPRSGSSIEYSISEIVFAAIAISLFKLGSRNALNNEAKIEFFSSNYFQIFEKKLPHLDTVDNVIRQLDFKHIEAIQMEIIQIMIKRKNFSKYRLLNQHHQIAVDGTGIMQVNKGHCAKCLTKTTNKGKDNEKTIYFHNVLEAKLICSNGFAISIGTEWIENEEDYKKQDCELNAFKRLSAKIKENFKRLPIVIVADGLYPNKSFFSICAENRWEFVVALQDGNLKTLWKDINRELATSQNLRKLITVSGDMQSIRWLNDLTFGETKLSWTECRENSNRFVFITSLQNLNQFTATEISNSGRLRSKIEDSFNTQKNRGYKLQHKFSRVSMNATKCYYACLQIAHLFNQLFELNILFRKLQ